MGWKGPERKLRRDEEERKARGLRFVVWRKVHHGKDSRRSVVKVVRPNGIKSRPMFMKSPLEG